MNRDDMPSDMHAWFFYDDNAPSAVFIPHGERSPISPPSSIDRHCVWDVDGQILGVRLKRFGQIRWQIRRIRQIGEIKIIGQPRWGNENPLYRSARPWRKESPTRKNIKVARCNEKQRNETKTRNESVKGNDTKYSGHSFFRRRQNYVMSVNMSWKGYRRIHFIGSIDG